jgi:hypothetical protein
MEFKEERKSQHFPAGTLILPDSPMNDCPFPQYVHKLINGNLHQLKNNPQMAWSREKT